MIWIHELIRPKGYLTKDGKIPRKIEDVYDIYLEESGNVLSNRQWRHDALLFWMNDNYPKFMLKGLEFPCVLLDVWANQLKYINIVYGQCLGLWTAQFKGLT